MIITIQLNTVKLSLFFNSILVLINLFNFALIIYQECGPTHYKYLLEPDLVVLSNFEIKFIKQPVLSNLSLTSVYCIQIALKEKNFFELLFYLRGLVKH